MTMMRIARWGLFAMAVLLAAVAGSAAADQTGTRGNPMRPSPGARIMSSPGSGIVPSFGSTIVPPFGAEIVPPLVPAQPCCRSGFDHRRPHRFLFPVFGLVTANSPTFLLQQQAPAPAPALPPPADFDPHLVTLKPFAARPGDPASVRILRPGQPDEIVKGRSTAR